MPTTAVALHMLSAQVLRHSACRQLRHAVEQPRLLLSVWQRKPSACHCPELTWSATAPGRKQSVRAKSSNAAAAADADNMSEALYSEQPPPAAAVTPGITPPVAAGAASVSDALYADSPNSSLAAAATETRSMLEAAEAQNAFAPAAAEAEDMLDTLYADSPKSSLATPDTKPTSAAAVDSAATAEAAHDILGALYDADESAAAVSPAAADATLARLYDVDEDTYAAAAAAVSTPTRAALVLAAAAAAVDGQQQEPPQAAAVAAELKQPSSPTASAGGNSSRVPPTFVCKPDIPADLDVFSNAVLLVDKPKTWTSFDACNAIKKAMLRLGVKKVGHAGTLDPAATGLLIICTGLGTKSIDGFMAAHKEYSGTLKLGEGTPTLDSEGEVNELLPWEHITDEQIAQAAQKLTGNIEQVPPMFSALHHQGQRLHELARAGVTVERQARPVTITRFDVHRDPNDKQLVHFYVGCSKGTYIRTLGHDLATSLGSTGHLVALRREAIGDARVDNAWEVETLMDKLFAAIREQRPEAFNRDSHQRSPQGRKQKRPRGDGRRDRTEPQRSAGPDQQSQQ